MEPELAMAMVHDMQSTSWDACRAFDADKGVKGTRARQHKAAVILLEALLGRKATEAEKTRVDDF